MKMNCNNRRSILSVTLLLLSVTISIEAQQELCGGLPPPNPDKLLVCPSGSFVVGDPNLYCFNNSWQSVGSCLPYKPAEVNRPCRRCCSYDLPTVFGGRVAAGFYRAGSTRDVICDSGETKFYAVECDRDTLQWSPQFVSCSTQPVTNMPTTYGHCSMQPPISNGYVYPRMNDSLSASVKCNPGYKHADPDNNRIVCVRGQWFGNALTCVESCPAIPPVINGDSNLPTGWNDGDSAQVTCHSGYILKDPLNPTIICSNKQWVGTAMVCHRACPVYPNVSNGRATTTTYYEGSTALVTCNRGYALKNANNRQITCRDGRWQGEAMVCHRIQVESASSRLVTSTTNLSAAFVVVFIFSQYY